MTILIDILHPAHVHVFRNLYGELTKRGHRVIVTAREKEFSIALLKEYGIPYVLISRQRAGIGLAWEMVTRTLRLINLCRKEKPRLLMGIMGPSIAVAGRSLGIPAWIFYDTENAKITNWFAYPLAKRIYTPQCYEGRDRKNQIRYPGYHELAYLHPNRFTPSEDVLRSYKIDPAKSFTIVRFVGWQASHDLAEKGLSNQEKINLVRSLQHFGSVYVTSESGLPDELRPNCLSIRFRDIHHILAYANLVIGESATMASEAAVLGVPAVFISDTGRGYTTEEEKRYGLAWNFTRAQLGEALQQAQRILGGQTSKDKFKQKRRVLLSERIDLTSYMLDEVERFLQSEKPCAA